MVHTLQTSIHLSFASTTGKHEFRFPHKISSLAECLSQSRNTNIQISEGMNY